MRLAALWLAALSGLVAGCDRTPPAVGDVSATIDGDPVHYRAFEQSLRRQVGDGAGGLDARVLSGLFDQYLDEQLLERMGPDEPGGAGALPSLLAAAEEPPEVDEEAVRRFYAEHQERFARGERVRLRHLLVEDRETAESARTRIEGGEPFSEVARELSIAPVAELGGRQGVLALDDLPLPFAPVVGSLAEGEVSDVVRAADGYHLFLVEERLSAATEPYESVAPQIRRLLAEQAGERRLDSMLERARRRYNVVVHPENLPFDYRGRYAPESPAP